MKHPYKKALALANVFIKKFIFGEYCIAGSIRRKEAMVGDVDIVTSDSLDKIEEWLAFSSDVKKVRGGKKKLDVDFKGVRFNIYHAKPEYWGAMIFFLTGPRQYEIAYRVKAKKSGWKLTQYGLFDSLGKVIAAKTEAAIYKAFNKSYKAPEMRGK